VKFNQAGTVPEVAAENGISVRHVYNLIAAGKLKTVKFGRARRIPAAERERLQREGA